MDVQPASEVMCSERLNGLNKSLLEVVTNAKVFVVGTGGIGCELIKNLVLTGFNNIEVIDLDTIDVSNLNRQFLFQKRHVGKSKAKVAHESAIALCPTANIKSNHASIFNPEYNMEYFKQFDIVLNALDNRTARNHVNRLCLAARIPLVESGSSGYLGQVSVIKRGETECYECSPKPRQKTFPGCTIRNTPSELIHCVIWAKYLFNQLFGEEDADQDVSPDTADPEAAGSAGLGTTSNSEETSDGAISTEPIIDRVNTRQWAMDNDYDAEKIFAKLFRTDIEYLLSMDKLWTKREKPTPLKWMNVSNAVTSFSPYEVSTLGENIENFVNSLSELSKKMISQDDKILVWDKDDTDALNFVASAANLRGEIFSIPQKSYFEIKSMAGNIIPAIATTNAMVAGLIVMQALNILNKQFDKCRNVFISRVANPAKKLISPCVLDPPSKSCYVCVEKPEITIELNTTTCKLLDFRDQFLKKHLGMLAPDVEIQDGKGTIILSSEEGETDEALPRCLSEIGVGHGVQLRADDFLQNYDIIINILHNTDWPEEKLFQVKDQTGEMGPTEEETCIGDNEVPGPSANNNDNDIEIVEISESSSSNDVTQGKKRKMSSEKETQQDEIQQKAKRSKLCIQEVDDDIVMID